jgi:DNA-binding CsgD family transcriptional regulator
MTSSMLSVPTLTSSVRPAPTEPVPTRIAPTTDRAQPGQPATELAPVRHLTLAPVPGVRGRRVSERERDVLALVADGHSTREVARRLCYSERSIKNILHPGRRLRHPVRVDLRAETQT